MAPKASDYEMVSGGVEADIRLSPRALEEYRKVCSGTDKKSVQVTQQLKRYFERYCNDSRNLPAEHFKKQGNFASGVPGTKEVAVWEFKPFQWRLYGAVLNVDGRKCFVGTRVDPNKKQDKADKALLEQTAKDIGMLEEYLGDQRHGKKG